MPPMGLPARGADSARRESSLRSYPSAPAASRNDAVDSHRGMHRHCGFGAPRITQNELAAMNRSARFPASQCVAVLRRRRDPAGP
jgi:hypothetical protein